MIVETKKIRESVSYKELVAKASEQGMEALKEPVACEYPTCKNVNGQPFNGPAGHYRWVGEEKLPDFFVFVMKDPETKNLLEVYPGAGSRPVILHYAHAYQMAGACKKAGVEFEMASLESVVWGMTRKRDFNTVVRYWQDLADGRTEEPFPKFEEDEDGNKIKTCGVPLSVTHTNRKGLMEHGFAALHVNSKDEVAGICPFCQKAYERAEVGKVVKLCGSQLKTKEDREKEMREKAVKVITFRKEKRIAEEMKKRDDEDMVNHILRQKETLRQVRLVAEQSISEGVGNPTKPAPAKRSKRAEREPRMPGGKQGQRRKDDYKAEAYKAEVEASEAEPIKDDAETGKTQSYHRTPPEKLQIPPSVIEKVFGK